MAAARFIGVGGRPQGCWGRAPTLGRILIGLNLIHGPMGQNKVSQHRWQKKVSALKRRLQPTPT